MWIVLTLGAAALQVVRNAAQRELAANLGPWGAAYVRFLYGLPFGAAWAALMVLLGGGDLGAPSVTFWLWVFAGSVTQGAATVLLVYSMRERAFAVAMALQKSEVLGSAVVGAALIGDALSAGQWSGALIGTAGITLLARLSPSPGAARAAFYGVCAGLLFSVSAVSFRAAAHSFGGDPWPSAAVTLAVALTLQTVLGAALLWAAAPQTLAGVLKHWRPSNVPGASGAAASALLFTAFAVGPSAGAVKTVQLVDVLMSWIVSRRIFQERLGALELVGGALILAGAALTALS